MLIHEHDAGAHIGCLLEGIQTAHATIRDLNTDLQKSKAEISQLNTFQIHADVKISRLDGKQFKHAL
jgi:hypothetical protein